MSQTEKAIVAIILPNEDYKKLKHLCVERETSITRIVRKLLKDEMEAI